MTTHNRRINVAITLAAVVSSQLAAIGYDEASKTLAVQFTPKDGEQLGPTYHYFDFPKEQFTEMQREATLISEGDTKGSVGSYFYKHVKGHYAYQRIESDVGPVRNADGSPQQQGDGQQSEKVAEGTHASM